MKHEYHYIKTWAGVTRNRFKYNPQKIIIKWMRNRFFFIPSGDAVTSRKRRGLNLKQVRRQRRFTVVGNPSRERQDCRFANRRHDPRTEGFSRAFSQFLRQHAFAFFVLLSVLSVLLVRANVSNVESTLVINASSQVCPILFYLFTWRNVYEPKIALFNFYCTISSWITFPLGFVSCWWIITVPKIEKKIVMCNRLRC